MDTRPLPPEAIAALLRGHKIDAIRIVREQHGVDLKAAKDLVDAYARDHPTLANARSPGEVAPRRALGWAVGLALLALLGAWVLFD